MEIRGYKAFNKDMTNRYGVEFKVGSVYEVEGDARFGNDGNGFHFCKRLEDTLRYFDGMGDEIQIAEVIGSGDICEYCDEYYGYYDMYSATRLEVVNVLSRRDIIKMFIDGQLSNRVIRFIQGYNLSEKEKMAFRYRYSDDMSIIKNIDYYQDGIKDTFSMERGKVFCKKNSGGAKNE